MMTEGEAKTKWCPYVRGPDVAGLGPVAANRTFEGEPRNGARCIASGCMAWRWEGGGPPDPNWSDPDKARGYCGNAGRP